VIRESSVGLWKNDSIQQREFNEKFYEVVTNPQITAGIQKKLQKENPAEPTRAPSSASKASSI
jgi:hypothetical protein